MKNYRSAAKRNKTSKIKAMVVDSDAIVKSIASLHKLLVDTSKQAYMAVDQVEDAYYSYKNNSAIRLDPTEMDVIGGAIESLNTLLDDVDGALKACRETKKSLRKTKLYKEFADSKPAPTIANDDAYESEDFDELEDLDEDDPSAKYSNLYNAYIPKMNTRKMHRNLTKKIADRRRINNG